MEKEFVPYKLAVKLKELGFDEPCFGHYDLNGLQVITHHWYPQNKNSSFPLPHTTNNPKISAPIFSQAFRWFRDKKLSDGSVCRHGKADGSYSYRWDILFEYGVYEERHFKMDYETYEEAELACLTKLIELIFKSE